MKDMYELWAKKRPLERKGNQYELVDTFYDEQQKNFMIDSLDRSIYMEAMVIKDKVCILYREFPKPIILTKIKDYKDTER